VFSTIAVRDGLALELPAHLARLGTSASELYGTRLPDDLSDRIAEAAAAQLGRGRLRVDVVPGSADPSLTVTGAEPGRPPVALATVTVPGGIGAHKWTDRRLLDALAELAAPALPLLVDLDGHVLESWGANVFARAPDGHLVTPPLDGRILPGVTRARLLAVHTRAREEVLTLEQLRASEEVFVTGSLGGAERVIALDGVPLAERPTALR
jgi:para-aminobenzoate synthetase/4-amino-4-deoxychorismate lyase